MDPREYIFLNNKDYRFLMKMNPKPLQEAKTIRLSIGMNVEKTQEVKSLVEKYYVL